MKTEKNKYKEKDAEKRRKKWNKTRREVTNKKWMLWVWSCSTQNTQNIHPLWLYAIFLFFFILLFFYKKK